MDNNTKTYQIDKHKQLIPLNGTAVNFSCFFEVKSKENKPFNITIVEQGDLKPKKYKLVEDGYINGQLESDGQLKTWFLILKSQEPCECEVRVVVKPKEASEPPTLRADQGPSTSRPQRPEGLRADQGTTTTNDNRRPTVIQQPRPEGGLQYGEGSGQGLGQQPPQFQNFSNPNMILQPPESFFQIKYIMGISVLLVLIYFIYTNRKVIFNALKIESKPISSDSSF